MPDGAAAAVEGPSGSDLELGNQTAPCGMNPHWSREVPTCGNGATTFFAAIASRPNPAHVALARGAHRREPIDPADEPIGTNKGRPWLASHLRGLTPCPNLTTIDSSPNRCPLGRQLCLPISPTSRKTRAPSCSRLLTLPRHPIRLRARRFNCLKLQRPGQRTNRGAGTRAPERRSIRS